MSEKAESAFAQEIDRMVKNYVKYGHWQGRVEAPKRHHHGLIEYDLSNELIRTYRFCANNVTDGDDVTYVTIRNPVKMWVSKTAHRVLDREGNVHVVPAIGQFGCVVSYKPRDQHNPVAF